MTCTERTAPLDSRTRLYRDGVTSLSDPELLELALGGASGATGPLARGLLERFEGLAGLARAGAWQLLELPDIGPSRAARLLAGLELGRRACEAERTPERVCDNAAVVARWFATRLGGLLHEELWVVMLDGRNRVRATRRVAQGGLHGCAVSTRDVLRVALREGAAGMLVVHNHPSGDPTPSPEDLAMTRLLQQAARVVGLPLIDHVVIGGRARYESMLELGILDLP